MKKLLSSMVAILALGAFANAGGGKLIEPPQVPPMAIDEWSGFYMGLQAGYIKGDGKTDIAITYKGVYVEKYYADNKPDGFIGGAYVGYNKLLKDNWLIGVELAGNYLNIDETSYIYDSTGTNTEAKLNLKQKGEGALYLKFGKVIDNQYMPYLLGGITATKLESKLIADSDSIKDSDTVFGFTVGAGVEFKINRNWHARVQYRYSKYKDAEFTYSEDVDNIKATTDYNTHSVMAGISYHF